MLVVFFFNDTATTEIYTLSLHDALPICLACRPGARRSAADARDELAFGQSVVAHTTQGPRRRSQAADNLLRRSEEHTSELQSQSNLVCRLLLEKKKHRIAHSHAEERAEL